METKVNCASNTTIWICAISILLAEDVGGAIGLVFRPKDINYANWLTNAPLLAAFVNSFFLTQKKIQGGMSLALLGAFFAIISQRIYFEFHLPMDYIGDLGIFLVVLYRNLILCGIGTMIGFLLSEATSRIASKKLIGGRNAGGENSREL